MKKTCSPSGMVFQPFYFGGIVAAEGFGEVGVLVVDAFDFLTGEGFGGVAEGAKASEDFRLENDAHDLRMTLDLVDSRNDAKDILLLVNLLAYKGYIRNEGLRSSANGKMEPYVQRRFVIREIAKYAFQRRGVNVSKDLVTVEDEPLAKGDDKQPRSPGRHASQTSGLD